MPTPHTVSQAELRDCYRRVTDRAANAAVRRGRQPDDVLIVAVTKTAGPDQIRTLIEMGHRDFGESRVQQLVQRAAQIDEYLARKRWFGGEDDATSDQTSDGAADEAAAAATGVESPNQTASTAAPAAQSEIRRLQQRPQPLNPKSDVPVVRWHMIGHLQRNKVKQVVPIVKLIHSVESLRLAEELHSHGARTDPQNVRPIEILLQVNASGEESKFGIAPPAVIHVAEQVDTMVHLRLRGLMTMAPYSDNPEDARPAFARTAELFHDIRNAKIGGAAFNILSMGMTDDFEIAIDEGANVVRIGRAIFGDGDGG